MIPFVQKKFGLNHFSPPCPLLEAGLEVAEVIDL